MNNDQLRIEYKKYFEHHKIRVIENTKNVQMFVCKKPGEHEFWFQVVCAENTVAVTGDCGSMLQEPGYGRSGLACMRGSLRSESYFLSKIRDSKDYEEYDEEDARAQVAELLKDHNERYAKDREENKDDHDALEELEKKHESRLQEIESIVCDMGEYKFQETWNEVDHDGGDIPTSTKLTSQTLLILAGLNKFCELLDEMDFLIGKTPVTKCFWNTCEDKNVYRTWINSQGEKFPICAAHLDELMLVHNAKEIQVGVWQVQPDIEVQNG